MPKSERIGWAGHPMCRFSRCCAELRCVLFYFRASSFRGTSKRGGGVRGPGRGARPRGRGRGAPGPGGKGFGCCVRGMPPLALLACRCSGVGFSFLPNLNEEPKPEHRNPTEGRPQSGNLSDSDEIDIETSRHVSSLCIVIQKLTLAIFKTVSL